MEHLRTGVLCPSLYHPDSFGVGFSHRLKQSACGLGVVDAAVIGALMERVHGVIVGFAEETGELLVIESGYLVETRVGGQEVGRSLETVPQTCVGHIEPQFLTCIMGYHTRITRQYWMHAQLPHTGENLTLET